MTPESTAVVVCPDVVDIGGGGIYVVQVNEGAIEASQMGCDWWYIRRPAFVASGTLRDVKPAGLIAGVIEERAYAEGVEAALRWARGQAGEPLPR